MPIRTEVIDSGVKTPKEYVTPAYTADFIIDETMFGKTVSVMGTATVTVRIPTDLSNGFWCIVERIGLFDVTFLALSGVTLQSAGTTLASQYTSAVVEHKGSNICKVEGKLT